jgi:hypothetical protein
MREPDELIEGTIETDTSEPIAVPIKRFQPWHKPRKHWIRINHWAARIRRLVGSTDFQGDPTFRYLTLAGDDLLDIRTLEGVFTRRHVKLRYMAFNDVAQIADRRAEFFLSDSELSDREFIASGSRISTEKMENISVPNSVAYQETKKNGPYDAINLDFCDDVTYLDGTRFPRFDLIHKLFEIQAGGMARPWLLFLTTRVNPDQIPVTVCEAFNEALSENFRENDVFHRLVCRLLFNVTDGSIIDIKEARSLEGLGFTNYYCLGFSKWLLRLVESGSPKWNLRLVEAAYYSVSNGKPDIVSLTFHCERVSEPPRDEYRLSQAIPSKPPILKLHERDLALEALNEVQTMPDLDRKLAENEAERLKVIEQVKRLLATARYRVDEYDGFLCTAERAN